jgi:hypothetical protein
LKRKRLPRLTALTIVMLLVIQSLPALAAGTNPAGAAGGTEVAVSAQYAKSATEATNQENSNSAEALDADEEVISDSTQLNPEYFTANYGQIAETTPRTVSLNDDPDWNWTDSPGRTISYCTLATFYTPNNNQEENNGFVDYALAKNIVSSSDADDCIILAGTNSRLNDNFTNELIEWANDNDLNWNEDTEIKDVSANFTMEIDYLDSNGEPADFLRGYQESSRLDKPSWSFSLKPETYSSSTAGELTETESMLKKEYDLSWENTTDSGETKTYTLQDIGSINATSGVSFYYFNPDYTGELQISPYFTFEYKFTVGDQSYDITFQTPDCTRSYDVVQQSTEPQYTTASDSDMEATVTSDGVESSLNTENDKVTAVQHGDEITYQIDVSSEAEAQVFYDYYIDQYPLGNAEYSDTVLKKVNDVGGVLSAPYIYAWVKPATEYLVFELTIPEGLQYDESKKDDIELKVDNSEGSNFLNWTLDDFYNRETVKIDNNQDGSTTIQCIATIPDFGFIQPGYASKQLVYTNLYNILNEKVTLVVPGITVSQSAKPGTFYTAKAKVYGSFYYSYENVTALTGSPVASKPSTGNDWDEDFGGWEDDTEQSDGVSAQSAFQSLRRVAAMKMVSALSDTATDYTDDPELNAMFPYPPDDSTIWVTGSDDQGFDMLTRIPNTNYAWNHLQNEEGRDVIQSAEEALETKELWYTVVIPAATISKDLPDDASEEDLSKDYTFGIQLEDEDLFGQTFEAARGEKQDDGTISYSDTAETVTFDENGYAEISLKAGEVLAIGLPDGCEYNVKEILEDDSYTVEYSYVSASGDETVSTGTYYNNDGIDAQVEAAKYTESDSVDTIDVTATNYPEGNLAISKRVIVPEEELAAEENKEFSFVLTLDNDDFDVNRDFTVKLYSDGVYNSSLGRFEYQDDPAEETMTIQDGKLSFSLKHGQTLEIDGLPDGTSYSVEEVVNQGFTPSYKNQSGTIQAHDTTYALCENTYDYNETTDITVNKVWAGDTETARPASVQAQLYRNGRTYGDPVTLKKSNGWSYTWYNLDADQEYTVAEVNVPDGYESSVTNENNVWTITNTNQNTVTPDTQSVKVNKIWANDDSSTRPSSVQMQLYQNGSVYGDAVTLSETNDWSYTWTGLDPDQKYTVAEVDVPDGYESSVTSADNVWTVTNTKKDTTTTDTHSVKVNKVWANDDSSTRPSSVQMQLYQNGEAYGDAVTLSETNDWSYTWTGLEADQEYTVAEVNVPDGYESSVISSDNVWTVTNTKKDTDTPSDTTTNTPGNSSNTTSNTNSNSSSEPAKVTNASSVNTGDTSTAGNWLLIILASAGLIFAALRKRANK